jgi:hypothetical protein
MSLFLKLAPSQTSRDRRVVKCVFKLTLNTCRGPRGGLLEPLNILSPFLELCILCIETMNSIECTNKHCWSIDLSSFATGQTTNKSFSAQLLCAGLQGKCLLYFNNTHSWPKIQCVIMTKACMTTRLKQPSLRWSAQPNNWIIFHADQMIGTVQQPCQSPVSTVFYYSDGWFVWINGAPSCPIISTCQILPDYFAWKWYGRIGLD